MATLTIGGKTVFTQSGTDEPVLSSDITFYNEHRIRYHSYENGHVGAKA